MTVDTSRPSPSTAPAIAPSLRRGVARGAGGRLVGLLVACAVLALVVLLSLAHGARPMPLEEVWRALTAFDATSQEHLIVRSLRVPRTVIGVAVGAALALAGAVMQGVTRNPLAEPGILGVNAGAAAAVVIAISLLGVRSAAGWAAFAIAGALASSVLVYALGARGRGGATPVKLALAGAATSAMLVSLTSAVVLTDVTTLDAYRFWIVGSLAGRDVAVLAGVAPLLVLGALLALGLGRTLNALSLGTDVASSLGQRVGLARMAAVLAVVLLVGGAVAVVGPIGFVGLVIPHVARTIAGPDYRWVLRYSAVLGPILLLGADIIGRLVVRPGELQVGVVTALVGAPFFVALVRRRKLADL